MSNDYIQTLTVIHPKVDSNNNIVSSGGSSSSSINGNSKSDSTGSDASSHNLITTGESGPMLADSIQSASGDVSHLQMHEHTVEFSGSKVRPLSPGFGGSSLLDTGTNYRTSARKFASIIITTCPPC